MTHGFDPRTTGPDPVLGYLQELILIAVLLGERLPGTRRPLRLLSGRGMRKLPSKIIRSNLAQSLKLDELPRRLDVLSLDQFKLEDDQLIDREFSFLAFKPPVWRADRVELSMVIGGMNREEGDWQCREIGHVNTEFREVSGRWAAISEPHIYLAPEH